MLVKFEHVIPETCGWIQTDRVTDRHAYRNSLFYYEGRSNSIYRGGAMLLEFEAATSLEEEVFQ